MMMMMMMMMSCAARVTDLDILEALSVQRIKENKQFLKMAAKCEKDLDLLRRKHEKVTDRKLTSLCKF